MDNMLSELCRNVYRNIEMFCHIQVDEKTDKIWHLQGKLLK